MEIHTNNNDKIKRNIENNTNSPILRGPTPLR